MSPKPRPAEMSVRTQGGFTLIEVVVATAIVGLVAMFTLGGLMYGMTGARRGQVRTTAAAWLQEELDYLRVQGYSFLADDVAEGTRTLTQTTGYTTYGDLTEPHIPQGFDRGVIYAEDVPGLPLRKLTISLYETPESTAAYVVLSTYVSNFTYATAP